MKYFSSFGEYLYILSGIFTIYTKCRNFVFWCVLFSYNKTMANINRTRQVYPLFWITIIHYLTRAVSSPTSDPGKEVLVTCLAAWESCPVVRACVEKLLVPLLCNFWGCSLLWSSWVCWSLKKICGPLQFFPEGGGVSLCHQDYCCLISFFLCHWLFLFHCHWLRASSLNPSKMLNISGSHWALNIVTTGCYPSISCL